MHSLSLRKLRQHFEDENGSAHAALSARLIRQGMGADLLAAIRFDVVGDDWEDFLRHAIARWWVERSGHLYLAVNAMNPRFFKLGKTSDSAQTRVAALANEAVIGKFELVQAWPVHDRHWLEVQAHQALQSLPRHKEFFVGEWDEMIRLTDAAVEHDRMLFDAFQLLPRWVAMPTNELR